MMQGLPNCCGANDITHIKMCLPSADVSNKLWLDHEKNYRMVIQAIVDPNMRFRDVVTGWPGSSSEFALLHNLGFFKLCQKGMGLNGKKTALGQGSEIGEYIVGDSGFHLLGFLHPAKEDPVKPIMEFNMKVVLTGNVAQETLVRFKDMWMII